MNSTYTMYYSKEECYTDLLVSLTMGVIEVSDISDLLGYYEEAECYECCQGIIEAYRDYKENNYEYNR